MHCHVQLLGLDLDVHLQRCRIEEAAPRRRMAVVAWLTEGLCGLVALGLMAGLTVWLLVAVVSVLQQTLHADRSTGPAVLAVPAAATQAAHPWPLELADLDPAERLAQDTPARSR